MEFKTHYSIIFLIVIILTAIGVFFIFFQKQQQSVTDFLDSEPEIKTEEDNSQETEKEETDLQTDIEKSSFTHPEIVKAIYVTSWSASKASYIEYIINIAKTSEINAVVIDIKDWSGYIAYDTKVTEVEKYNAKSIRIRDIDSLIQKLHEEGIYLIARTTIFQDPVLAEARPDLAVYSKSDPSSLWLDNKGLAWIDPAAKESWDYNIAIVKEAAELGFDEINFDYIRFPSDGNLNNMGFPFWDEDIPKNLIIKDFFEYLRQEMPDTKLSVDLFGLSTVNRDDLGIGQVIEDAFEYFDYICPMVYPSHYATGFLGRQNPAEYPYEVVRYSMEKALERLSIIDQTSAELRPWLQDFNLGAIYDAEMVKAQIKAVYDSLGKDFKGFMLWSPSNIYTKEACSYVHPE